MRALIIIGLLLPSIAFANAGLTHGKLNVTATKLSLTHQTPQAAPTVTSFTPTSACAGNGVEFIGTNLSNVLSVTFGPAGSTPLSATFGGSSTGLTAIVPNGATSGIWTITTAGGIVTVSGFTVTTASSCGSFAMDLTSQTLSPLMMGSRTGVDIIAQTGTNTAKHWTSAIGYVVEDYGDGSGPGTWSFDSRVNNAASVSNFADPGYTNSSVTVSANAIAGPDGVVGASSLLRTATGACGSLTSGPTGAANNCIGISSLWTANSSTPPNPLTGAVAGHINLATATSFPNTAQWTHTYGYWAKASNGGPLGDTFWLSVAGANIVSGAAVCDNVSGGAIYAFGAQSVSACDNGVIPLIYGASTGAAVLQVAAGSLASTINGNDMHLKACYNIDRLFQTNTDDNTELTIPHVWSMQTADGVSFIEWSSQTVFNLSLNGGAVSATLNPGALAIEQYQPSELCWEWSSEPSTGTGFFRVLINNARSSPDATFSFAPIAMHTPTVMYLGSYLNGDIAHPTGLAVRWTRFQRMPPGRNHTAEFFVSGDSLLSNFPPMFEVATGIYTISQARGRPGIIDTSFPGETIQQQQARYDASPQKGQPYVTAFIVLVGNNNIEGPAGDTDVQAIGHLQTFVNDIHTNNPTAKIFVYPNLPTNCAATATPTIQGYLINYDNDIVGTGPNPLIDPGGGVLVRGPLWTSLSGGATGAATYCYTANYDSGDHIHENSLARATIVAPKFSSDLTAAGLLQ